MSQAFSPELMRHGGRVDVAARLWPDAPRPWLDLSTGINPRPWMPPALTIDAASLPSPAALAGLERAAASFFGSDPVATVAVPGSELALRLLAAAGVPRPIVARRPGYGTHAEVADEVTSVAPADLPPRAGTYLLAEPNNPDGRSLPPDLLADLAARQRAVGGLLAIDAAFHDASGEPLPDDALVLRSFGKFFGLAGVRLGFVVAPDRLAERFRRLLGDWPVSAQAIAWGTAAYRDEAWIAGTRRGLAEDAARLDALLAEHGYRATGASPLFRLIEHRGAAEVFERLARAGILARRFADRPGWLRLGPVRDDAGRARLVRALRDG